MPEETIYRDTLMQLVLAYDNVEDFGAFTTELDRARQLLGLTCTDVEEDALAAETLRANGVKDA